MEGFFSVEGLVRETAARRWGDGRMVCYFISLLCGFFWIGSAMRWIYLVFEGDVRLLSIFRRRDGEGGGVFCLDFRAGQVIGVHLWPE